MEQHLAHTEKRQSQISFSSGHQSLMASKSWPTGRRAAPTTLPLQTKNPLPSPLGTERWNWPGTIRCTCLSGTKGYTWSLKQGKIPVQGDKPSPSYEDSIGWQGSVPGWRRILMRLSRGQKTACTREAVFPTMLNEYNNWLSQWSNYHILFSEAYFPNHAFQNCSRGRSRCHHVGTWNRNVRQH